MKTTETTPLQQDKIQVLEEHIAVLEQQLDWFKRQLFGRKSEVTDHSGVRSPHSSQI